MCIPHFWLSVNQSNSYQPQMTASHLSHSTNHFSASEGGPIRLTRFQTDFTCSGVRATEKQKMGCDQKESRDGVSCCNRGQTPALWHDKDELRAMQSEELEHMHLSSAAGGEPSSKSPVFSQLWYMSALLCLKINKWENQDLIQGFFLIAGLMPLLL